MNIQLLTRDYGEVQKGKNICDRVYGVAKARMRLWVSSGNDLLNANDIKEGMEYAGGVKNTKIAVAEIVPGMGKYYSICSNHALIFFSLQVAWVRQMCPIYLKYVQSSTIHSTCRYSKRQTLVLKFQYLTKTLISKKICE